MNGQLMILYYDDKIEYNGCMDYEPALDLIGALFGGITNRGPVGTTGEGANKVDLYEIYFTKVSDIKAFAKRYKIRLCKNVRKI